MWEGSGSCCMLQHGRFTLYAGCCMLYALPGTCESWIRTIVRITVRFASFIGPADPNPSPLPQEIMPKRAAPKAAASRAWLRLCSSVRPA